MRFSLPYVKKENCKFEKNLKNQILQIFVKILFILI